MPLLLLLSPPTAAAAGPAPAPAPAPVAVSLPPPSRLRASHLLFAFPRLRKYGRRDREPVATSLGELEEEDEDEEEEEEEEEDDEEVEVEVEVDEDEFLKNRPKPVGFGAGKTYSTDIEEQLLREMGLGGRRRSSGSGPTPAKNRAAANSAKGTGEDLNDGGVCVRVWNLPKKKNIHKDLNLAFKGFPGLVNIEPAVSANKKTRDPICKGFAYLKLESVEAATSSAVCVYAFYVKEFWTSVYSLKLVFGWFVELYSQKAVSFGKVQKPIRCCVVDSQSSVDSQNQPSSGQAIRQPGLMAKNLVAAS
uniref:RRM domain-containing protein n=1 Tax=Oryza nivara TaxID=4536 RepID=A0A0E0G5T1_ORYNI